MGKKSSRTTVVIRLVVEVVGGTFGLIVLGSVVLLVVGDSIGEQVLSLLIVPQQSRPVVIAESTRISTEWLLLQRHGFMSWTWLIQREGGEREDEVAKEERKRSGKVRRKEEGDRRREKREQEEEHVLQR